MSTIFMATSNFLTWNRLAWMLAFFVGLLYISHLGVIPVHATADECRRALVPLEMTLTGDWLTPTLNGTLYLNKPPLFNWLVACSYAVVGEASPFALRLPVVISILIHGILMYLLTRQYTGDKVACLAALAFMTNWRTLTLDSMLGLLEHTLALSIYAGFIAIYIFGNRRQWGWLFGVSYFFAAIGFLIKGLPAVAHHGIALLVYVWMTRSWKKLFSFAHAAGIVTMAAVLLAYYIPFFQHNGIGWNEAMGKLYSESAKRYGFQSVSEALYVFFDFPLDLIKHFLPWTLLLVLFFKKTTFRVIRENQFVWFHFLLFAANVPIYWMASLKNPHYLYFLLPLLFLLLIYAWEKMDRRLWPKQGIEIVTGIWIAACILVSGYLPFSGWVDGISGTLFASIMLMTGFGGIGIHFLKKPADRLLSLVLALMLLRLAFNWFVIPQRVEDQMKYPRYAASIHQVVQEKPLFIYASWPAGYYDAITFPLENRRREILPVVPAIQPGAYHLVDDAVLQQFGYAPLISMPYDFADRHEWHHGYLHLILAP